MRYADFYFTDEISGGDFQGSFIGSTIINNQVDPSQSGNKQDGKGWLLMEK